MVVIHLKTSAIGGSTSADDGFLYETTTSTSNEDLVVQLVELQNLRRRSALVADAVRGLADYGISKRPEEAGATDKVQELIGSESIERGPNYVADPTGMRTGEPPEGNFAEVLKEEAQKLEDYVDKSQIKKKVALTAEGIEDRLQNVRGAVTMAYPEGLPEYDLVRIALDEDYDRLDSTYIAGSLLNPLTAALYTAGKEFDRTNGKLVSDRLGSKNEKTKVIAKLVPNMDSGAPAREPVVNEEERKGMMAQYFKRQEELKRLAEADDGGDGDDYLNSAWADGRGLKHSLQGLGDVQAPGLRF